MLLRLELSTLVRRILDALTRLLQGMNHLLACGGQHSLPTEASSPLPTSALHPFLFLPSYLPDKAPGFNKTGRPLLSHPHPFPFNLLARIVRSRPDTQHDGLYHSKGIWDIPVPFGNYKSQHTMCLSFLQY